MKSVILHGHIFKNAGTTLDWSLEKMFGDGFLDHRQDKLIRTEGSHHLGKLLAEQPRLRAVSSHHMPVMQSTLPGVTLFSLYLLRRPLDRIVSVYEFERSQKADTPGARAASSKTFLDYVRWRMTSGVAPVIRNYQTLYLAGAHRLPPDREIGMAHFLDAIETLRGHALTGIVERYDESMVCFEEALRTSFPDIDLSYIPQNVSAATQRTVKCSTELGIRALREMDDELQSSVLRHNGYDLSLYRMADELLDDRIRSIDGFNRKLELFRERCERLHAAGGKNNYG